MSSPLGAPLELVTSGQDPKQRKCPGGESTELSLGIVEEVGSKPRCWRQPLPGPPVTALGGPRGLPRGGRHWVSTWQAGGGGGVGEGQANHAGS